METDTAKLLKEFQSYARAMSDPALPVSVVGRHTLNEMQGFVERMQEILAVLKSRLSD